MVCVQSFHQATTMAATAAARLTVLRVVAFKARACDSLSQPVSFDIYYKCAHAYINGGSIQILFRHRLNEPKSNERNTMKWTENNE